MKRFFLTCAVLLTALVTFAQTQLPSDPAIKTGKLSNGITYYIRHNAQPAQRAEFYLATNVGAFQETDDQDGLAHFLEHMCFNGTKNFPGKGILEYLQSIGAEFGRNINASTGFEQTSYMLNNIPIIREGIIDSCLMILRDYSHYVTCDPKEIDAERGVILEERRSRRTADWRMLEQSLPYYFGDTQMARRTLIGGEEQLKTFKYESLTNFYRTWYNPDMQAVIVVGDVDVDKIEEKIKNIFGEIPAPEQPTVKPLIQIPENETPQIAILTDPEASTSMIEALWRFAPIPREFRSTDAAFMNDIITSIIGNVMDERFNDITSKADAPFLMAGLMVGGLCESSDAVQGTVVFKDGQAQQAFKAFMLEVEKFKRYGFTEGEVERAKEKIISRLEKQVAAADSRKNDELVQPILNSFFAGDYNMAPETELQLTKAVLAQLPAALFQQLAQGLITDKNCVVISKAPQREGLVQPTKEELAAILSEVKNAEISANVEVSSNEPLLDASLLKGSKSSKIKDGTHGSKVWKLKNGIEVVYLKTDYKKDQVLVDIVMDGGRSLIETEELPTFDENIWTLFLQNRGLSTFPGTQLKKMLAGKNVRYTPYIQSLRHGISAESTPKDIETAFQLIYLNMAAPRFDNEEFQLGITQLNAILPNLASQPSFRFQEILTETLYNNNPRKSVINADIVSKANIETMEKVYRRLFGNAQEATLYVVGNIELDSVKPMIEKYIGSIEKGKASKWTDRGEDFAQGTINKESKIEMETPKSTVFQFYSANIPYSVKNEVMLDACKQIIDMVYTETLRESEGGTYGAGVATLCTKNPKPVAGIQVVFETNPQQQQTLAKMAHEGILNLANNGIPADKLAKVVENLKKNIPEQRISNNYWKNVLLWKKSLGVDDYDKEYEEAVSQITSENIVKILAEIVNSNNYIELIMSPAE